MSANSNAVSVQELEVPAVSRSGDKKSRPDQNRSRYEKRYYISFLSQRPEYGFLKNPHQWRFLGECSVKTKHESMAASCTIVQYNNFDVAIADTWPIESYVQLKKGKTIGTLELLWMPGLTDSEPQMDSGHKKPSGMLLVPDAMMQLLCGARQIFSDFMWKKRYRVHSVSSVNIENKCALRGRTTSICEKYAISTSVLCYDADLSGVRLTIPGFGSKL